jgi:hypothetical protein
LPGVDPSWSSSISDYENDCYPIKEKCVLIKERPGTPPEKIPLSNSWVSFRNMYFHVSDDYIPKVTINFDM